MSTSEYTTDAGTQEWSAELLIPRADRRRVEAGTKSSETNDGLSGAIRFFRRHSIRGLPPGSTPEGSSKEVGGGSGQEATATFYTLTADRRADMARSVPQLDEGKLLTLSRSIA